jgi:hypothetical protein
VNPKLEQQLPPLGMPAESWNKKKKRSAFVNAPNPHQLQNYILSRLARTCATFAQFVDYSATTAKLDQSTARAVSVRRDPA